MFIASSQISFAYVTDNSSDYGVNNGETNNSGYFLYAPKGITFLTKDVRDLQAQIDVLEKRNADLNLKMLNLEARQSIPVITQTQVSSNDATQTQRIDTLENKVGTLETLMGGLKTALDKTISLLTKLLSLIK